jgi:hypothetical protein
MPTVIFWLNAFIPRDVPGYTKKLTTGPFMGKTAIPLPKIARLWPVNMIKPLDTGYLTDQRSFDNSPGTSVRVQSLVEVDVRALSIVRKDHRSSGTQEVNLVTGLGTGYGVADTSACSFQVVEMGRPGQPGGIGPLTTVARGGGTTVAALDRPRPGFYGSMRLRLTGAARDPLVGLSADIDYEGTVSIDGGATPGSVIVSFDGLLDDFPAFECYASFNGVTKEIFTEPPPAGNTVADLLGYADRPIVKRAKFP